MFRVNVVNVVLVRVQSLLCRVPSFVFVLVFIALFGGHTYRTVTRYNTPGVTDFQNRGYVDFHNAIYFPGKYFLEGGNPYSLNYTHQHPDRRSYPLFPTHSLLLHLPFSQSSLELSRAFYFITQAIVLLAFLIWIAWDIGYAPSVRTTAILGSLMMLTVPFYQNFYLGQLTLQVAFGTALALRYAKDRPLVAAIGLAISAIKPQVGVIIAVLMLCRRDFKAVLGGAALSTVLSLIGLLVIWSNVGWAVFWDDLFNKYFSLQTHPELGTAIENYRRIDLYPIFERWMGHELPSAVKLISTGFLLFVGSVTAMRVNPARSQQEKWLSNLVIILTALLAVYHSNYDALLVFWPLAVALSGSRSAVCREESVEEQSSSLIREDWRFLALCVLLIGALLNVFTLSKFLERIDEEFGPFWQIAASSTSATLFLAWWATVIVAWTLPRSD